VLLCSYYNSRLYPVVKGLRTLTSLLGHSYGSADTDLSVPPKPINSLLHRIFASELPRLISVGRGLRPPYRQGVSLVAVLSKNG
ncbi:MAG: hypothetical protein WBW88_07170, partial [Rhodothermales bacterium]